MVDPYCGNEQVGQRDGRIGMACGGHTSIALPYAGAQIVPTTVPLRRSNSWMPWTWILPRQHMLRRAGVAIPESLYGLPCSRCFGDDIGRNTDGNTRTMQYATSIPLHGDIDKAFRLAESAFTAIGFRITKGTATRIELAWSGMNNTRQSALLGASLPSLHVMSGEVRNCTTCLARPGFRPLRWATGDTRVLKLPMKCRAALLSPGA